MLLHRRIALPSHAAGARHSSEAWRDLRGGDFVTANDGTVRAIRSRRTGIVTGYVALLPRELSVCPVGAKNPTAYQQPLVGKFETTEAARIALGRACREIRREGLSRRHLALPPDSPGVYVVQGAGGFLKIGKSQQSVRARLKNIQTAHPVKLRFLGLLSVRPADERLYHARFAEHRRGGEWYAPAREILDCVRISRGQGGAP